MRHEQTQSGNPHGLTINQHIFPSASIARFAQRDGFVLVFLKDQQKTIHCRPQDKLFCARRVWNQAAEHGFMKRIEDTFQVLATRILSGTVSHGLGLTEHKIVTQFYALCRLRAEARLAPLSDVNMNGALTESSLSKNQEEILEKNGYIFVRGNAMPGRHVASIRMQVQIDRMCAPETSWAIVYSRDIEFVVPDSFFEIGIVPLSPNYCLVANQRDGEISSANAIAINRLAIDQSSKYYLARDFLKCGICPSR